MLRSEKTPPSTCLSRRPSKLKSVLKSRLSTSLGFSHDGQNSEEAFLSSPATPAFQLEQTYLKRTIVEVDSDSEDDELQCKALPTFRAKKQRVGEEAYDDVSLDEDEECKNSTYYSLDRDDEIALDHPNEADELIADREEIPGTLLTPPAVVRSLALKVREPEALEIQHKANSLQDEKEEQPELDIDSPYSPQELNALRKESYFCLQMKIAEQLDVLEKGAHQPKSKRMMVQRCKTLQQLQAEEYKVESGLDVTEEV